MGDFLDSSNSLTTVALPLAFLNELGDDVEAWDMSDTFFTSSYDLFLWFGLDEFSPCTGYNGYYRPAILTDFRFSLLYQIPGRNSLCHFFLPYFMSFIMAFISIFGRDTFFNLFWIALESFLMEPHILS